jgi:hypothetical protein
MIRAFWPILLLAAAAIIVTRPKVWYWAAGLGWRLAWRALVGRKK